MPSLTDTIDIHCHIFNAADLPIPQFVRWVVMSGDPPLAGELVEPLIECLLSILDEVTPSADTEINVLNQIALGDTNAQNYLQTENDKRDVIHRGLQRFLSAPSNMVSSIGGVQARSSAERRAVSSTKCERG